MTISPRTIAEDPAEDPADGVAPSGAVGAYVRPLRRRRCTFGEPDGG
jgi:hypothetical protein